MVRYHAQTMIRASLTFLAAAITLSLWTASCQGPNAATPATPTRPAQTVDSVPVAESTTTAPSQPSDRGAPTQPVEVEMFVMSQCPFSAKAHAAMLDVVRKLGPNVRVAVDYVGTQGPKGELKSMHGNKEVIGDIAQVCAARIAPAKLLELIVCQNRNQDSVDSNWDACAAEVGIPGAELARCVRGQQGAGLLTTSFSRTKDKGVTASPTLRIGGKPYAGVRSTQALLRAICREYASNRPALCATLPEAPKVNVAVVTDKRCTECEPSRAETYLRLRVESPQIRVLEYADPEGRKLFESLKPGRLPILVFDSTLDADPDAIQAMDKSLRSAGATRYISLSSDWNPVCQDKGGCAKAECNQTLGCRKEAANRIELFMMAHCPYCGKRVQQLQEVLKGLDPRVGLTVQFVGTGDAANGFKSMHGPEEVAEDLREICAAQHYRANNKFLDYMVCRGREPRNPDWTTCTGGATGFDVTVLRKCADGPEGKRLLEASFKYSQAIGIDASPTFVVNNKFKFTATDAAAIKAKFCERNKAAKGCM
jgi:predicted DsbA family dithiol-disulfide isomerase